MKRTLSNPPVCWVAAFVFCALPATWTSGGEFCSKDLRLTHQQTRKAANANWDRFDRTLQFVLDLLLALPSSDAPRILSDTQTTQVAKIQPKLADIISGRFNVQLLYPPERPNQLVPLDERVRGFDSFGLPIKSGPLYGYIRCTHDYHILMFHVPASFPPADTKPVTEFTETEVAAFDTLDRLRYEMSRTRPSHTYELSNRFWIVNIHGLVDGSNLAPATVQHPLAQRGLQLMRQVSRLPDRERFHWYLYDLGFGLYGEAVLSVRPTTEYGVRVLDCRGKTVRFLVSQSGEYIAICASRRAEVHVDRDIPPLAFGLRPDWFDRGD